MFWRKKKPEAQPAPQRQSIFSTDLGDIVPDARVSKTAAVASRTVLVDGTQDSAELMQDAALVEGVPDAQFFWYASQSFIGYQACAIIAQHWLVDRACLLPARDALRQGYEIQAPNDRIAAALKTLDKRYKINSVLKEYVHMGRVFGIRVAIFRVNSPDPDYYEKPFNIDGVPLRGYVGISQVDPIWISPVLTTAGLNDPANIRFYDPQFWMINGKKYHHSHLCIYVPHPVTDVLKPSYHFGGMSVPQLIYERVYAAERTANEAPQLAMTKRTGILKVNAASFMSNLSQAARNLATWASMRDNYGVKVVDKDAEDYEQFDVALGDLDVTIMTQYQLVAAIAEVPATKLLGTTPKGFNATGEHESENYRQTLESIQTNDMEPLLDRHHMLLMKSELGVTDPVSVSWEPLDSPTAAAWSDINLKKAQAAQVYAALGAIDGMDVREQLAADKNSDFHGLAEIEERPETQATPEATENDPTQTPATGT